MDLITLAVAKKNANANGKYTKTILTTDWILDGTTYKYLITNHGLDDINLLVNIIDDVTGLPIYFEYKIVDANNIEVYSDDTRRIRVILRK